MDGTADNGSRDHQTHVHRGQATAHASTRSTAGVQAGAGASPEHLGPSVLCVWLQWRASEFACGFNPMASACHSRSDGARASVHPSRFVQPRSQSALDHVCGCRSHVLDRVHRAVASWGGWFQRRAASSKAIVHAAAQRPNTPLTSHSRLQPKTSTPRSLTDMRANTTASYQLDHRNIHRPSTLSTHNHSYQARGENSGGGVLAMGPVEGEAHQCCKTAHPMQHHCIQMGVRKAAVTCSHILPHRSRNSFEFAAQQPL
jgi:hypothetical protein